jgi:hypothetical protein
MSELLPLGKALAEIERFPARHALFLPADEKWDERTLCAVLPLPDEVDDPPFAKEHDLTHAMDVYSVQDVVANARLQTPDPSARLLVEAFLFYFDNDAFIVFDSRR